MPKTDAHFAPFGGRKCVLRAVGLIWGLCIFNLIYVFLFCVGKMTHLNFKSTDDPDATIFQKYPIVWWSDLLFGVITFNLFVVILYATGRN